MVEKLDLSQVAKKEDTTSKRFLQETIATIETARHKAREANQQNTFSGQSSVQSSFHYSEDSRCPTTDNSIFNTNAEANKDEFSLLIDL